MVFITTSKLSSSEDRSIVAISCLIAGAIVAGVSLIAAAYMGYNAKKSQDLALRDTGKVVKVAPSPNLQQEAPVVGGKEGAPEKTKDPHSSALIGVNGDGKQGNQTMPQSEQTSHKVKPQECAPETMMPESFENPTRLEKEAGENDAAVKTRTDAIV
jgi:hypothetical protein